MVRTASLFELILFGALIAGAQEPAAAPSKWEKAIRAFEAEDAQALPTGGSVLFVGSSTIRLWDLKQYFPGLPALNRGFGGSQMSDVNEFAGRIVLPYKPGVIVLYSGDNDLASGKTPNAVFEEYKKFIALVAEQLPETRVVVLGVKPSPARWSLIEAQRVLNKMLREHIGGMNGAVFIDTETPMLDETGRPRKEFFAPDELHMSPQGYELWTGLLRPHLPGGAASP